MPSLRVLGASARSVTTGLMFLIRILHDRIREAILGNRFDPRVAALLAPGAHRSGGAGSSSALPTGGGGERDTTPDAAERARYAAQPTPAAAYATSSG